MMTLEQLKTWAKAIKRDIIALYLAGRDPRVPWYARAMAAFTAAYALSPIDLIPDFIPVVGYLDDLIIVPVGILLAVRLIPRAVMADLREQASLWLSQRLQCSRVGVVVIVMIWVILGVVLIRLLFVPNLAATLMSE